jgi:hypothetical protein
MQFGQKSKILQFLKIKIITQMVTIKPSKKTSKLLEVFFEIKN